MLCAGSPLYQQLCHCEALLSEWNPQIPIYLHNTATSSSSASAGVTSRGTLESYRDIFNDAKLTPEGVQALCTGRWKCTPLDIQMYNDELELPPCSYEHPYICKLLCRFSKYLNADLALPRDQRTKKLSWELTIHHLYKDNPVYTVVFESFRINLRVFSQYRVLGLVLLLIAYASYRLLPMVVVLLVLLLAVRWIYTGDYPTYVVEE
jgi:hypothetical protein